MTTLQDLGLAYRKAKVDLYYSSHASLDAIADYEEELHAKLSALLVKIEGDDEAWVTQPEFIGRWTLAPKSVDMSCWEQYREQNGNGLIFSSPAEEWAHACGLLVEGEEPQKPKAEFRVMAQCSLDFHVLSTLWMLEVGHLFDAKLTACAYGNRLRRTQDGVAVVSGTDEDHFEWVLAASGRNPNLQGLGLEKLGLETDTKGMPVFNRHTGQIGNSHVFIAGDVNGDVELLHEAADEGRIAGDNAGRFPEVVPHARRAPLAVMFTDPQVMLAGQSHADLTRAKLAFETGAVSFEDQGRSRVILKNQGALHVYGERGTGRFLGAQMVGPAAEHLGHLLAWSVQRGDTVQHMLDSPFYHPVIEEGLRTALRDLAQRLAPYAEESSPDRH